MTVPLTDPERLIAQLEHIEKSPGDLWDQMTARRAREEISRLTIERDNLQAARDWAVDRLYPYVLERAGPKPVPLERIAGLAAERIDALARQQPSQFARLDELHTASARAGVSWGLHYQEADGSWRFSIHSQAPAEDWGSPKDRSFEIGVDEVLEYLAAISPLRSEHYSHLSA